MGKGVDPVAPLLVHEFRDKKTAQERGKTWGLLRVGEFLLHKLPEPIGKPHFVENAHGLRGLAQINTALLHVPVAEGAKDREEARHLTSGKNRHHLQVDGDFIVTACDEPLELLTPILVTEEYGSGLKVVTKVEAAEPEFLEPDASHIRVEFRTVDADIEKPISICGWQRLCTVKQELPSGVFPFEQQLRREAALFPNVEDRHGL